MSGAIADPRLTGARAAPKKALRLSWSDPVFRAIVWQVVVVALVALIVVSIIGVYGPTLNMVKIGDAMNKGLTIRTNQANIKRNLERCLEHIQAGHITPKDVITHRIPLEEIAEGYHIFASKLDNVIKPMVIPPRATA